MLELVTDNDNIDNCNAIIVPIGKYIKKDRTPSLDKMAWYNIINKYPGIRRTVGELLLARRNLKGRLGNWSVVGKSLNSLYVKTKINNKAFYFIMCYNNMGHSYISFYYLNESMELVIEDMRNNNIKNIGMYLFSGFGSVEEKDALFLLHRFSETNNDFNIKLYIEYLSEKHKNRIINYYERVKIRRRRLIFI